MLHLECPNCQATPTVEEWNKEMLNAISLGVADVLIPEDLDADEYEEWEAENGGTCDCPECGERVCLSDLTPY